jgi:hypothetical protein
MRKLALFVAVTFIAAACADQNPSAPGGRSASGSVATDQRPSGQGIKVPEAKPTDQIGFTKVTSVFGAGLTHAGFKGQGSATCPAGSVVVGGGFNIIDGVSNVSRPIVTSSADDGSNGWFVVVDQQGGATDVHFSVFAYCLS